MQILLRGPSRVVAVAGEVLRLLKAALKFYYSAFMTELLVLCLWTVFNWQTCFTGASPTALLFFLSCETQKVTEEIQLEDCF